MKVQIVSVHPRDACFATRGRYIGKVGKFTRKTSYSNEYVSGWFMWNDKAVFFYHIHVREVEK